MSRIEIDIPNVFATQAYETQGDRCIESLAYLGRMEQAERWLREPDCTVAEVANRVGYANPAQFAAAFKRQFGITPSDCILGRGIVR